LPHHIRQNSPSGQSESFSHSSSGHIDGPVETAVEDVVEEVVEDVAEDDVDDAPVLPPMVPDDSAMVSDLLPHATAKTSPSAMRPILMRR
jgi:hypothetical protein